MTPLAQSSDDALKHGCTGVLASIFTWMLGALEWYSSHLNTITGWVVHVAQIGGLVIMFYSYRILRRNWKTGSSSRNPFDKQ